MRKRSLVPTFTPFQEPIFKGLRREVDVGYACPFLQREYSNACCLIQFFLLTDEISIRIQHLSEFIRRDPSVTGQIINICTYMIPRIKSQNNLTRTLTTVRNKLVDY